MNRKTTIASITALTAALLALIPANAVASSPLLSGYGGPGAGEQALIGSTLSLPGNGGGAGGGGRSGAGGESASSQALSGQRGGQTSEAAEANGASARKSGGGSSHGESPSGRARGNAQTGGSLPTGAYPSGMRVSERGSPALGLSGGDLLWVAAVAVALAAIAGLTATVARLQR